MVAPNHGAAPEIVLPGGETGWLFWPESVDDLARALDSALALDEAGREALKARAMKRVRENFSKEHMVDATMAVYRRILGLEAG